MTGTPTNILRAIENALEGKPPTADSEAEQVRLHIKDFLAQRFGTAMLESPECGAVLNTLFENCTKGRI